ncbi:MAG: ADP-glyceromanno-heptose 6-epimerase [Chlamydiae bacterium]|nr:ADP-glyceromanno-heptose 6-epimerase [Chlamydiota bacterium]
MSPKMYDSPLIVITGAAGCIGSCLTRHLNNQGKYNLLLVDDIKKTEKWKNLHNKRFVDFISKHDLKKWLEGRKDEVASIVHLGACSDTMESDGDYLMQNNYRYSIDLADFALDNNVRFIYASSAATYGDGSLGFSDNHQEIDQLQPLNVYGFSKHLFDLWIKGQGALDQVVGLKYFNVFGPNENHKGKMASMVYKMMPVIQKDGFINLYKSSEPQKFADGDQCRDFIYVKDAVRMTADFLDNDFTGIYNIGSGHTTTWNALAKALFKALGKPEDIRYIDMPDTLIKQYQNYTCADMFKFKEAFGYLQHQSPCQFNTEESVADYVQNYLLRDRRW